MEIQRIREEHIKNIVSWCEDKDADFLTQWAGRGYTYPITEEQIKDRLAGGAEIFEANLDGRMVGTIEIITRDEEAGLVYVGRFVLNPALVGQGLGTQILDTFMQYCKEAFGARKVGLCVFDFNTPAYRCYKKCGFQEIKTVVRPNGWKAIEMEKVLAAAQSSEAEERYGNLYENLRG